MSSQAKAVHCNGLLPCCEVAVFIVSLIHDVGLSGLDRLGGDRQLTRSSLMLARLMLLEFGDTLMRMQAFVWS